MLITLKSGEKMHDLVALSKGLIQPGNFAYNGELLPEQSNRLISLIFADSFLSQIQTYTMKRLTQQINVVGVTSRNLVRVPQGVEPDDSDKTGGSEFGAELEAKPAQLFTDITLDWIRTNSDNPNLAQEVENGLVTSLQNDLVDLGFNGIGDDNIGANRAEKFLRLNKGWIQLAKDHTDTQKVTGIDPDNDNWENILSNILSQSHVDFRENSQFIMNLGDADQYARQISSHVTGTDLISQSPARRYQGIQIVTHPKMPRGHILFTPLKNLGFGIHHEIHQDKTYHSRKRVIQYTWDKAFDYEIAVKKAVTIGIPA